jgi:hypothetical protein
MLHWYCWPVGVHAGRKQSHQLKTTMPLYQDILKSLITINKGLINAATSAFKLPSNLTLLYWYLKITLCILFALSGEAET